MNEHKCELCGTPVRVVGDTTQHYEVVPPVWTADKPTQPGWYWLKPADESPRIVEVIWVDDAGSGLVMWLFEDFEPLPNGLWSGPIPEPAGAGSEQ